MRTCRVRRERRGRFHLSKDGQLFVTPACFAGYVCTYCQLLDNGPVVLQVLQVPAAMLTTTGSGGGIGRRCASSFTSGIDRLAIRDFRGNNTQRGRGRKEGEGRQRDTKQREAG